MGKRTRHGRCNLCSKDGPLTFEHVPPECAFNDTGCLYADIRKWLEQGPDTDYFASHHKSQRGGGDFTLCKECNDKTGGWYAAEYGRWAKQGAEILGRIRLDGTPYVVPFRGYPLRFLKQCVALFFSINSPNFARLHPRLARFVHEPYARILPHGYEVYLTLVSGPRGRSSGLSGIGDITSGQTTLVSELAHFPFAISLTVGPHRVDTVGRISRFGEFFYDERRDVQLPVTGGQIVTLYPRDYRGETVVAKAREEGLALSRLPPSERGAPPGAALAMRQSLGELQERLHRGR